MPANVTMEYVKAERKYANATTLEEKLKCLEDMFRALPKHKGTEMMQAELKRRMAKTRRLMKREKELKRKGKVFTLKKQGSAQVCFFSLQNTGKSYWMNKICRTKLASTDKPFETQKPVAGIMDYDGVKIQLIEIPSVFKGFASKYPNWTGIVRTCDLIVIIGNNKIPRKELKDAEIKIKSITVGKKDKIKEKIWTALGLIRIFTKEPKKKKTKEAFGTKKGARVRDVAKKIHKDFVTKFRFARIWGSSVKFQGQQIGLNHKLKDGDIVEFHIKK